MRPTLDGGVTRTHPLIPKGSTYRVLGDDSEAGFYWTEKTKLAEPGISEKHQELGYNVKVLSDEGDDIEVLVKDLEYVGSYIVSKSFIVLGSITYPSSHLKKAACTIQRVFRGRQGRRQAICFRLSRWYATTRIQSLFRNYQKSNFNSACLLMNLYNKALSNSL